MNTPTARKPIPVPDADSAPFWAACKEHRLVAQRCLDCSRWRWPPQAFCRHCHSARFQWEDLRPTGRVVSHVTVERAFDKGFAADVPYVVAHVAIDGTDDEVILVSNLIDFGPLVPHVGLPVEVTFEAANDSVMLPKFRPRR